MSLMKTLEMFIADNPGLTSREIAEAFADYSVDAVQRAVCRLHEHDFTTREWKGNQFRYYALTTSTGAGRREPPVDKAVVALLENHIMYRLNGVLTPYHQHIEAERFEVKTGTTNASNYAFSQARFTAKGVKWIGGLWSEYLSKGHMA